MKERLDQLRAMDSAAFMTLPASSFSSMPKEAAPDSEGIAASSSPYTHMNGYFPHAEGERRRKQMLDVATMLEERYRILLPPDRVRRAPEPVLSESASRTQVPGRDGDDSETDRASIIEEKLRLRLPARSSTSTTSASSPVAITPTIKKPRPNASSKQSSVIRILRTAVATPSSPPPTLPHVEASPLSPSPTIDMDIPPSPSPEELEPTPSSPSPTVATVLPQTIFNEASMVEPVNPGVPLSNGAANALGIVSEQNYTSPEQMSLFTPPEQEMPVDQEMLPTPPEQERISTPQPERRASPELGGSITRVLERRASSDLETSITRDLERRASPELENSITRDLERRASPELDISITQDLERRASPDLESPIARDLERRASPDLESPIAQDLERRVSPELESSITRDLERRASPELESSITRDPERVSSPSPPVPNRSPTPLEREKSIPSEDRISPTPLVRDRSVSVIPEQEPPLEERPVTPERLPTSPAPERTTTSVPERPPTPPALITLAEVADQEGLPEKESSTFEPRMAEGGEFEKAETEDGISVRAETEVPAPQNEPEKEVDVESEANKMDVEQYGPVEPIPTVAAIEQVAVADSTINAIPEATLIERTTLLDVPMTQVSADSDPTVIEQADMPVSEIDFILDRPVTPEQKLHTEPVDIEAPMPISSLSAPRSRSRKRPRLDPSIQNETVSAPVRGPRVPKNHVTYRGESGEMEVTASAIIKAAVHRTQRDVTRHLNAFGVPVPNAIVQMGPPFELPEWVFPPLSPAESEHAHGDFDVDIEDFELDPTTPSKRQMTSPASKEELEAGHTTSIEVDPVERAIVQPTRQSGPKIAIPRLPPQPRAPEPVTEEDTVSLGDEDT